MEWVHFAVRVRSRQIVLAVVGAGFVIAIVGPEDSADLKGLAAAISFFAGVGILGVVGWWGRFWRGGRVFELRMRTDPTFAARVAAMDPGGAATFTPEGDHVLAFASGDPHWTAHVQWLHAEGLRDEEIAAYWSQSEATRDTLTRQNNALASAVFKTTRDRLSGDGEAALQETIKGVPLYGGLQDYEKDAAEGVPAEDRRLPDELSIRVARWARHQGLRPRRFRAESAGFSSMNARIRHEIRAGRL